MADTFPNPHPEPELDRWSTELDQIEFMASQTKRRVDAARIAFEIDKKNATDIAFQEGSMAVPAPDPAKPSAPPQGGRHPKVYVEPLAPTMRAAHAVRLINRDAPVGIIPNEVVDPMLTMGSGEHGIAANQIVENKADVPPWYALIDGLIPYMGDMSHEHGGGVIIDRWTILTAAHVICVPEQDGSWTLLWDALRVFPGNHHRHIMENGQHVNEITVHSMYEGPDSSLRNDMALLHLSKALPESMVCPNFKMDALMPGELLRFWGTGDSPDGISQVLRTGQMRVIHAKHGITELDDVNGDQFERGYSGSFMTPADALDTYCGTISHYQKETTREL